MTLPDLRGKHGLPFVVTRRSLITAAGASAVLASTVPAKAAMDQMLCMPGASDVPGPPDDSMVSEDFGDDYTGAVPEDGPGERRVHLINSHTGETFDRVYVVDGQYNQEALQAYNVFCRDWRVNEVHSMDPGLLDIIWKMATMLETTTPWYLNSAYRSKTTNTSIGGAKASLHMYGKANDITHPDRSENKMYNAALEIHMGGCGKYTSQHFVHVDTGQFRTWGS